MDAPPIYPIPRWWTRPLLGAGGALVVLLAVGWVLLEVAGPTQFRCYFPPSDAASALTVEWEDATRERWVAPSEVCLALSQVVAARNHDGWPQRLLNPQTGYAISCEPSDDPQHPTIALPASPRTCA
jgi:hypothetical protein